MRVSGRLFSQLSRLMWLVAECLVLWSEELITLSARTGAEGLTFGSKKFLSPALMTGDAVAGAGGVTAAAASSDILGLTTGLLLDDDDLLSQLLRA